MTEEKERQEESKAEMLADQLRSRIVRGDFGSKGRIPSVTELARARGVARQTVYDAVQLLQIEGLLIAKGPSLYVCYPKLLLEGIAENFERKLRSLGLEPVIENLIDPSIEAMPPEVAAMFGQPKGVRVVHRMRRQGIEGQTLRVAENWYPVHLAGELVEQMKRDEHMDVVGTIKNVHGIAIVDAQDVLIPRTPSADEARMMSVARNIPIIEIRRSNFDQDGNPVMWNKILHVSPFFQYTYRYPVAHWNK